MQHCAGRMLKPVSNQLSQLLLQLSGISSERGWVCQAHPSTEPDLHCCRSNCRSNSSSLSHGLQWGYTLIFPVLPPAVGLSPNSVTNSPNSFICHLIQCSFISSCLSFWEHVCHMFMSSSFFKKNAKTKFLGVLETPHINYKGMYTWVGRIILSLHYSQYLFPLVNHSDFFKRTFQWQYA